MPVLGAGRSAERRANSSVRRPYSSGSLSAAPRARSSASAIAALRPSAPNAESVGRSKITAIAPHTRGPAGRAQRDDRQRRARPRATIRSLAVTLRMDTPVGKTRNAGTLSRRRVVGRMTAGLSVWSSCHRPQTAKMSKALRRARSLSKRIDRVPAKSGSGFARGRQRARAAFQLGGAAGEAACAPVDAPARPPRKLLLRPAARSDAA